MLISSKIGAEIFIPNNKLSEIQWLFSEDQSRYLIATSNIEKLIKNAQKENIVLHEIGKTIKEKLILKNHFEIPIKKIIYLNNKWFYNYNS